ncbi:hypothetical protein M422DRAFT_152856, partial [Sphaerobolus stellatus SS14]
STIACSLLNTLPGKVAFPGQFYYIIPLSELLTNPVIASKTQHISDNEHWTGSSSQPSACSVEPSTREEVATIKSSNLGCKGITCFFLLLYNQVKDGGHAFNPGFSLTDGVLVFMSRFNEIHIQPFIFHGESGSGNLWNDVYAKRIPLGVNVVGGRVPGIGRGRWLYLGGSNSWKTQKYGLALGNVLSFELVTPTLQILDVTAQSHPDLFFGRWNFFGIVTAFVLKTHPQGQVYLSWPF